MTSVDYEGTSNNTRSSLIKDERTKSIGAGPVLGLDMHYRFLENLELYVNDNFSVLVQRSDVKNISVNRDRTGGALNPKVDNGSFNYTSAVSAILAKTGINYKKILSNGELNIQCGWVGIMFDTESVFYQGAQIGLSWVGGI